MNLNQFPHNIAKIEQKILEIQREIEIQSERLFFFDADIEKAIASAQTLKNEQQRKCKRLDLQQQPDYLEAKAALKEAKEKRETLLIKLNLLRNQFSVAKLETRMSIAQMESNLAA